MIFNPKNQKKVVIELQVGEFKLKSVDTTKFLGVWIDNGLSWNEHLKQLTIKLKRNLGLLRNSKKFLPKHSLKMLYYAQIYIHLSYGISVWGSMITKEQLNKLSKIQRKAISLLKLNSEVEQIMGEEKILNLDQIIQIELLKIRHHLSTNTLPVNLAKNQMYDHLLKCLQ